jgi:hypothetical protein
MQAAGRVIRIMAMSLVLCAAAAQAEVARPATAGDTLRLMRDAYAAHPQADQVQIDTGLGAVITTRRDGTDVTSYPDNLHRALQDAATDADRQAVLDRFVASAFELTGDLPPDPAALMPVLRPPAMFAGQTDGPISAPFPGPLEMFFVLDAPSGAAFVTGDMLGALRLDAAGVQGRAIANLQARDGQVRVQGSGPYMIVADGYYESSLLLDPALWDSVDAQIGQVVALPLARDLLLFADADRPDMLAALKRIVAVEYANLSNMLTSEALVLRDGVWIPFVLP